MQLSVMAPQQHSELVTDFEPIARAAQSADDADRTVAVRRWDMVESHEFEVRLVA